jgi:predicted NAD-dependent protein-ADP-ribosyltransferase YbiA (DUF1768 family)
MAADIKNGKKLSEAQKGKISAWLQNTSDDFRTYQRSVMYRGNLLKFVYPVDDPKNMRAILLCSTINRRLFFADTNDYWGIGETFNDSAQRDRLVLKNQFNGENTLGKILEDIRTQLFTSSKPSGSTTGLDTAFGAI